MSRIQPQNYYILIKQLKQLLNFMTFSIFSFLILVQLYLIQN